MNEQLQYRPSTEKSGNKRELKEYIGRDQVKTILRQWLDALENDQDLEVQIKGQTCRVPKLAFDRGRVEAEFEYKNGEYELELELKWKESDLSINQ